MHHTPFFLGKIRAMDNEISVSAKIVELQYRARVPLPALSRSTSFERNENTYRLTRPSKDDVLKLAVFEDASDTGAELAGLTVAVEARPRTVRKEGTSAESLSRFLRNAYELFVENLDPSSGRGIAKTKQSLDETHRSLTQFGNSGDAAQIILYVPAITYIREQQVSDPCVTVELRLSREGCAANGLHDVRAMIGANTRKIFGSYINLATRQGARLGDLNARIKRELERSLPRATPRL